MLALVKLAKEYGKGAIPIGHIADSESIPRRFLEGILLELKRHGLVDSARGKAGGYFLSKLPVEIALDQIITLFEGSVGMLACVCSQTYQPCEFCKDENICKIRQTFKYVHESTAAILKSTTLQDLT